MGPELCILLRLFLIPPSPVTPPHRSPGLPTHTTSARMHARALGRRRGPWEGSFKWGPVLINQAPTRPFPPPCVIFRLVVVSLWGPGQSPFLSFRVRRRVAALCICFVHLRQTPAGSDYTGRRPPLRTATQPLGRYYRGGGGKFRPGTISQGIISPGENFATLEIPKAPSKHVSRNMSLNFRKKIFVSRSVYAP